MNLTEETYLQEIEELKKEISLLRKEVTDLSAECLRLQEVANITLQKEHQKKEESNLDLTDLPDDKDSLKTENEMLKAIIDNMGVGVGITDTSGNTLSLNKAALKIHGFQSEEEMFSPFIKYTEEFELQYPDGRTMPVEEWPSSRAMRGEFVQDYEVKLIRIKTNRFSYINYSAVPVYNDLDELMLMVFNMTDITELKLVNDALLDSEKRYSFLFNNKTNGITHCKVITNEQGIPVDYELLDVNDTFTSITGISKQDIKSKTAREVFPGIENYPYDYIGNYGSVALRGGELNLEDYLPIFGKWLSIYAYSPKHGEFTVIFNDITDRKKAEEELKINEAALEAFFASSPGILNLFDQDLKYIKCDKHTPAYFGHDRHSIVGKSVADLNPSFAENFLAPMMRSVIETGKTELNMLVEGPVPARNGELGYWSMSYFPVPLPGGNLGFGAIGVDVTEVKQTEKTLIYERELFEGIFNNIPLFITIYEPSLKNFRFNKEMKQVLGWTEEDATDGKFLEKVYPDPEYREKVAEYMKSLQPGWQEYSVTAKDGSKIISSWANILLTSGVQIGIGIDIREQKKAEIKLHESEKRLKDIFNHAAIGIVEIDKDTRFIFVNDRICAILGYSRDALLEKTVLDITAPDDVEHSRHLYEKLHNGEVDILNYEKRYIKADGIWLWVHVSVSAIRDSQGKLLKSVGTVKDISERKQVEKALKDSEERFRLLADNISQMVWIADSKGKPIWFNKRWHDYTGLGIEEMQKDGSLQVNHPDYAEVVRNSFYKALNNGEVWENTFPLRGKNGEFRWFLSRAMPIRDKDNSITLWFGTNTDITEQRKIEEELRHNEQRLEGIFNNAAIGIVETDPEDRFVNVNDRICRILGYSFSELVGKTVNEITAPEDRERSDEMNERLHRGNFPLFHYEKRYLRKDGSKLWVHVSVSSIRDSKGNHIKSIGTIEDISERKQSELRIQELLKQAEEGRNILTALMEYVPLGITIADAPGVKIRMVSKYGQELLGEEIVGIPAHERPSRLGIYHLDGITPATFEELPLTRATIKGEVVKNEEWFVSRKDGSLVPILCNAAPILDKDKNVIGGIMGWQDITERRKILEELRNNEERLRIVLEAAQLGTWDFDIDTGIAVHSLRHDQIFGYAELQPEWSYEISVQHMLPEFHPVVREAVARAIETGDLFYEAKIKWPDGSIHWIAPRGKVHYSQEGKPMRMLGIVADITERKMIEEAVIESEEKFRSLFENITEGVALHEIIYENGVAVNYRITNVNPAYERYCGIDIVTAEGSLATNLYGVKEPPYFDKYIKVAETREPFSFETFFPSMNKYFIINVVSPKKGQFATVFEDISDQKRNEQEIRQKNEELTRFIYTVSHDLKSPLVTIKSFASFLQSDIETEDKEAIDRDIGYIMNAADKMGRLLDELLELSRIGRKEDPKVEVPLEEIAQNAIDLVAGRINKGKVKIEIVGPPVMLYGHTPRLIQLYQNLIDNSVKFMDNQSNPVIEIGTTIERNNLLLYVKDNGSGIDPRYHHKIFGLFEKLDNSKEGTGIGLALVKRIVEVHGGSIWFTSEGAGKGTTFYFTLERTYVIKKH